MFSGLYHEENEVVVKGLLSVGNTSSDKIWMAGWLKPFNKYPPTGITGICDITPVILKMHYNSFDEIFFCFFALILLKKLYI